MTGKKTCPICGELFNIPQTRPNQIYCSRDCAVIGRRNTREKDAHNRVDTFIESLPDLQIYDVLEGRLGAGTNNRMFVTGSRAWAGKKFVVLVVNK